MTPADHVVVTFVLVGIVIGLLAGLAYGWQYREQWKRGVRDLLGLESEEAVTASPSLRGRPALTLVLAVTVVASGVTAVIVDDPVVRTVCAVGAGMFALAFLVVLFDPRWGE